MKKIKFAMAAMALSVSASASAGSPQSRDGYADQAWTWVYAMLTAHRPCVGPELAWCGW